MARHGGPHARLIPMQDGSLALDSSYDPGLVAALKAAVPYSDRRWNPDEKMWRIGAQHGATVASLAAQYLGVDVQLPAAVVPTPTTETRLVRLEYLGAAKDRGNGETVAFGYVGGDWSVMFPVTVLKRWFEVDTPPDTEQRPGQALTLFATLGLKRSADGAAVKTAYRRLARQWHPDVCKEPDAHEQFLRIQYAYDVLSNPQLRARYEAGLVLEQSTVGNPQATQLTLSMDVWRAPLRCGWLLVEGTPTVGRFAVTRIVQWEDITDTEGRVMTSYWPAGAEMFVSEYL